jgi:hypothetical protein
MGNPASDTLQELTRSRPLLTSQTDQFLTDEATTFLITAQRRAMELSDYMRGGTKRQTTHTSWMQTCMRPSLDSRTGKSCGTIAVPTADVTTS